MAEGPNEIYALPNKLKQTKEALDQSSKVQNAETTIKA
jgi:hypothetical protein